MNLPGVDATRRLIEDSRRFAHTVPGLGTAKGLIERLANALEASEAEIERLRSIPHVPALWMDRANKAEAENERLTEALENLLADNEALRKQAGDWTPSNPKESES